MASINDSAVSALLDSDNLGIVSTLNEDGTVHSAVAWVDRQDGRVAVNSAVGRLWPTNLSRDPRITVLVVAKDNPNEYVEVRGHVGDSVTGDRADRHIDGLAKKYVGVDEYPFRQPGEERIMFLVDADRVRYQNQG